MYAFVRLLASVYLLACIAGCSKRGTVQETEDAAVSPAYRCDYASPHNLHINRTNFGDLCFAPRKSEPRDLVRIPSSSATFETRCAVTIDESKFALAPSACSPRVPDIPLPIMTNDVVSIDRNPESGSLELTRLRGGMVVPLKPGSVDKGGVPYLISDEIDGVIYAVYLEVAGVQGSGIFRKFEKMYRIEMFDLRNAIDPGGCREHLPTFESSTSQCPTGIPLYMLQTGTSTGGEPPPR